jgi:hypothetical protein
LPSVDFTFSQKRISPQNYTLLFQNMSLNQGMDLIIPTTGLTSSRARDAGSWAHIASPGSPYLPRPGDQILGPTFPGGGNNAGRNPVGRRRRALFRFPCAGAAHERAEFLAKRS